MPEFDPVAAKKRCEAATPEPWEIEWESDPDHDPPRRAESVGPVVADHDHWSGWTVCNEADAEFIAHARTDLPAALEALEEAQGKLEAVEEMIPTLPAGAVNPLLRILRGSKEGK